jgi:hypothetical protein
MAGEMIASRDPSSASTTEPVVNFVVQKCSKYIATDRGKKQK